MNPILGRYGPFFLYSFSVIMWLGILAGIGMSAWRARRSRSPEWIDGILVGMSAGLIGGRIGFVVIHWGYFQDRPAEMWQLWRGGLTYHGALLAGLTVSWLWYARRGRSLDKIGRLLAPGFALASTFGWLACYFDGCAFGQEAPIGLLTADLPDTVGIFAVRYPTQLLGIGFSLLTFVLVIWIGRKWAQAPLFAITLLGLSIGRVIVALLRGDDVPHIGMTRADVLVDSAIALASLVLLQYRRSIRTKAPTAVASDPGRPQAGSVIKQEGHNET